MVNATINLKHRRNLGVIKFSFCFVIDTVDTDDNYCVDAAISLVLFLITYHGYSSCVLQLSSCLLCFSSFDLLLLLGRPT